MTDLRKQKRVSATVSVGSPAPPSGEYHTNIPASETSVLLVSSRPTRAEVIIYNDSNKYMYVCAFSPAVLGSGIYLQPRTGVILDKTSRAIHGIWETGATGKAVIQEFYYE